MKLKNKTIINLIILFFILYLFTMPRYVWWLPTIPIYNNDEALDTYYEYLEMNKQDYDFFKFTDQSVVDAFLPHVYESKKELYILEQKTKIVIKFFKYLINRPRPYQIDTRIKPKQSKTDKTPSMPAGHAMQAYFIAKELSKKYPEKEKIFYNIAKRCDEVRIKAGIHYKSDGELSRKLVDIIS